MSLKLVPTALLACLALALVPSPIASSYPNECVITGANGPGGQQYAPPCIATDATNGAGVPLYSQTCGSPLGANPTTAKTACKPFYIFLIPDQNGNPLPPPGGDGFQSETVLWQENNNCPGLQRAGGAGCYGADARILG